MNETDDKKLEHLIDKIMKETSLETPSIDFASSIMSKVDMIANSSVTPYRPLISKPVWVAILALIIGTLAYPLFYGMTETSLLTNINTSVFTYNAMVSKFSNLVLSKRIMYSAVIFALMFAVQISFLKLYFNKRLSV